MTLPFTSTLRGHCWVIDWLNLNIVVPKGIEKPREREMGEQSVNGAVITCIMFIA